MMVEDDQTCCQRCGVVELDRAEERAPLSVVWAFRDLAKACLARLEKACLPRFVLVQPTRAAGL
jgi:hypothetical protein